MRTCFLQANTKLLRKRKKKYLKPEEGYKRFYPPLIRMKRSRKLRGLDFGTGCGGAVVLGNLLGLKMTGVDVPSKTYGGVHEELQASGYDIRIFDTRETPWPFRAGAFDFVLNYCALGGRTPPKQMLDQLVRITKRNGIWLITRMSTIRALQKNVVIRTRLKSKSIRIVRC